MGVVGPRVVLGARAQVRLGWYYSVNRRSGWIFCIASNSVPVHFFA